jgi:hypothetical protein
MARGAATAALHQADLGDNQYPVTWWSIYITKGNADIPLLYFHRFAAWLAEFAVKGAGSTERGEKKSQLHLQAMACLHCPADEFGRNLVRDSIKKEFPIPTGAGYRVDAKPFAQTQTPIWMLGYILKDHDEPWFNCVILGFSEADCNKGMGQYCIRLSGRFEEGKTLIFKKEFVSLYFQFYEQVLAPLQLTVPQIVRYMILSGKYLPGTAWLYSPGDKGLNLRKVEIHRKWSTFPHAASLPEVLLFFFDDYSGNSLTRRRADSDVFTNGYTSQHTAGPHDAGFIPVGTTWMDGQWGAANVFDNMCYHEVKELAGRKRGENNEADISALELLEGGSGDTTPFTVPTMVATNGTFVWNTEAGTHSTRHHLDLNGIAAADFDVVESYANYVSLDPQNAPGPFFIDRRGQIPFNEDDTAAVSLTAFSRTIARQDPLEEMTVGDLMMSRTAAMHQEMHIAPLQQVRNREYDETLEEPSEHMPEEPYKSSALIDDEAGDDEGDSDSDDCSIIGRKRSRK